MTERDRDTERTQRWLGSIPLPSTGQPSFLPPPGPSARQLLRRKPIPIRRKPVPSTSQHPLPPIPHPLPPIPHPLPPIPHPLPPIPPSSPLIPSTFQHLLSPRPHPLPPIPHPLPPIPSTSQHPLQPIPHPLPPIPHPLPPIPRSLTTEFNSLPSNSPENAQNVPPGSNGAPGPSNFEAFKIATQEYQEASERLRFQRERLAKEAYKRPPGNPDVNGFFQERATAKAQRIRRGFDRYITPEAEFRYEGIAGYGRDGVACKISATDGRNYVLKRSLDALGESRLRHEQRALYVRVFLFLFSTTVRSKLSFFRTYHQLHIYAKVTIGAMIGLWRLSLF